MITKLKKFIQSINGKKRYNKTFMYSQIIKNERAKRKLTLAEISKGICSISYLCKFEKNDIVADESYIRAIFERVNLDFNLVGRNILKDGIENSLKAYLADDYEALELLYNSIDDSVFNAQNYLIKCFHFLVNKKYNEFNENIKCLDNIKETLLLDDVGVLLFLVVQYYIETNQYQEAKKILSEIESLNFTINELTWLIDEQHYNVGFYLAEYPSMFYQYKIIVENNYIGYPSIRKTLLRAKYLYAKANTNFPQAYAEFQQLNYNNINPAYHDDITYWRIATYIKGRMDMKAFDEIYDNGLYYEARFVALILLSAYNIGDDNYINLACDIASKFELNEKDSHDLQHNLFIKFMLIFLKGKYNHEYVEFLKDKILPNRNKYSHFIYSPIYLNKYIYFLKKSSRYKEAFTLLYEKYLEEN